MLMRLPGIWLALSLAACSGSQTESGVQPDGVLAALANPDRVELVALHPYPHQIEGEEEMERLHGYGVLGRAALDDSAQGNEVLALIEQGIEASNGMVAACFNPRHGLTVTQGEEVWDLVICFECLSMQVYLDGERNGGHLTVERYEPQVTAIFETAGLTIHADD